MSDGPSHAVGGGDPAEDYVIPVMGKPQPPSGLYLPQPGSTASMVLDHLRGRPPGTWVTAREVVELCGCAAGDVSNRLSWAVKCGALVRELVSTRRARYGLGQGAYFLHGEAPSAEPVAPIAPRRQQRYVRGTSIVLPGSSDPGRPPTTLNGAPAKVAKHLRGQARSRTVRIAAQPAAPIGPADLSRAKITLCPSVGHDPRYQLAPGAVVDGPFCQEWRRLRGGRP